MDQRKEEEDSLLKEPTDQRSEEEDPADQRKAAAAAEEEEEERSSDEESVSASTLFVHPCSLLQYLVRAFACCLGMQQDSFAGTATKPSATVAPASLDSSRGGETADRDRSAGGGATGFYVQEVITRVWALRRGPRPPGKPREGSGGNGGHHH